MNMKKLKSISPFAIDGRAELVGIEVLLQSGNLSYHFSFLHISPRRRGLAHHPTRSTKEQALTAFL